MSPLCFVGNVVIFLKQNEAKKYAVVEAVVLDFVPEHTGLYESLLVLDPKCSAPEVVYSTEVVKVEFTDASPECQLLARAFLFQKDSKKYLNR